MNITVNGRHVEITPALRSYAEDKIGKFDRYFTNITGAVVTLSVQKYLHTAEVLLHANGTLIQAQSTTNELYSAIDEVADKLDRQVKKLKEKVSSHRKGGEEKASAAAPAPKASAAKDEEVGVIFKRERFDAKPMSAEDGAMQMETLGRDFFVFMNSETSEMNVLYRRTDGNYGLIEPAK